MKKISASDFLRFPNTQRVYLDGRTTELNASVVDHFKKRYEDREKLSDEQAAAEAAGFALSQVPSMANDIMGSGGIVERKFKNLKETQKEKTVESVKDEVRTKVFETLGKAESDYPKWGDEYKNMLDAVENENNETVILLQERKHGYEAIKELKHQYERQAQVILSSKSKINKKKIHILNPLRNMGILGGREEKENTNDYYRFEAGNTIAVDILGDLESKMQSRMSDAEAIVNENVSNIKKGFSALSQNEKSDFLEMADLELSSGIDQSAPYSDKIKAIIAGMEVKQRLEVYRKAKMDIMTDVALFEENGKRETKWEEALKARRDSLIADSGNLKPKKFKDVKDQALVGIKADESFNPKDNLDSFVKELADFISIHDSAAINFGGFPEGETPNSFEQFARYFSWMCSSLSRVKRQMPKSLKAKLLTIINWLEEQDNPDVLYGYSKDFMDEKTKIQNQFYMSGSLLSDVGKLGKVNSVDDIDDDLYKQLGNHLVTIEMQKSDYEKQKMSEENKLSEKEIAILDEFYAELSEITQKMRELKAVWVDQKGQYAQEKSRLEAKKSEAEDEKIKKEVEVKLIEDGITDLKKESEPSETELNKKKKEFKKKKRRYDTLYWKYKKGTLDPDEETEFNNLHDELDDVEGEYKKEESKFEKDEKKYEDTTKKLKELSEVLPAKKQEKDEASKKFVAAEKELSDLLGDKGKGIPSNFDLTTAKNHFFDNLGKIKYRLDDLNNAKVDGKAKYREKDESRWTQNRIARYFIEESAKLNNEQHKKRLIEMQKENLERLKFLPEGTPLNGVFYKPILPGNDVTTDPTAGKVNVGNCAIMDKTDDAVILFKKTAPSQLIVIQQSKKEGEGVNVLKLAAPSGFSGDQPLPPSFVPKEGDNVGALIAIH